MKMKFDKEKLAYIEILKRPNASVWIATFNGVPFLPHRRLAYDTVGPLKNAVRKSLRIPTSVKLADVEGLEFWEVPL